MKKVLQLDPEILNTMDEDEEPIKNGINSNVGKRNAYEKLVVSQRNTYEGKCNITFFSLIANYRMHDFNIKTKSHQSIEGPPLLIIDEYGNVTNKDAKVFKVENIIYRRRKLNAVVNLVPYIPIDKTDESSCYATLLLHVPWPNDGENGLLGNKVTAVAQLKFILDGENVPLYLPSFIDRVQTSQGFLGVDNKDDQSIDDDDSADCSDSHESIDYHDNEMALNSEGIFDKTVS
jgi:hypothetical protein